MSDQNTPTNTQIYEAAKRFCSSRVAAHNLTNYIEGLVSEAVNKARAEAQLEELRYANREADLTYNWKVYSRLRQAVLENRIRELETPNQVEGERGKIYPVCNDCMKQHSYICPHVETPEERKETREERHSRLSDHWSEL